MTTAAAPFLAAFRSAAGDRNRPERLYAEGALHLAEGSWDEAERCFHDALAAGESSFYLKIAQGYGQALYGNGNPTDALGVFEKLAAMRPDLLEPRIWQALCLLALERPAEAFAVHQAALAAFPGHDALARVVADGAVALDRLGRHGDAIAWCRSGLEATGSEPTLWLNLAAFHFRIGDRAGARDALVQSSAHGPHFAARAAQTWQEWGDGSPL